MVKQFTVAAVYGGMIGHRCAKAAQQDIARLCRGQGHPVKACDRHIVQVKVLTVAPPVILTLKIRHINSRQMVGIPEQRVTVRHPVLKAPSCQMWHTAEFMNFPPADQPPGQCTFYLQPPVGLAQPGQTTGMTVDQCHNLPLHFCPQPVLRRHPEIIFRLTGDIHAGKISFPFRRSHHEAARLRWRTSPGVRQYIAIEHENS
ncbi:hypothetical protein ECEH1995_04427 [Escherichia coli O145:H28]|nr:hypothetical protein ECEH1995_04427 [Escherichia coli O145:H28]